VVISILQLPEEIATSFNNTPRKDRKLPELLDPLVKPEDDKKTELFEGIPAKTMWE